MNWLKAIEYVMENPNKKLLNNKNEYNLCSYNGIPMILKEKGVYTNIGLDLKFCELEWRTPIKLTKYNVSVYVDNCLINNHEKWINENGIQEYVAQLHNNYKNLYNSQVCAFVNGSPIKTYDKNKLEIKYESMFDENLNIITKEN